MANDTPPAITDADIVADEVIAKSSRSSPVERVFESANVRLAKKLTEAAPSRSRRTAFVFGSWFFSFFATVGLSIRGGDGTIAKAAVDGFTSYMMAVATMYIVGYSVDSADYINKAKAVLMNKMGGSQE